MEAPVHIGHSDWSKAWIACSASEFLGVLLTQDDWLDDLWIVEHARRSGLGKELMKLAEKEIAGRGFQTGKLRVVSTNQNAINFYKALGWLEIGLVAHDLFPIQMNEMCKALHK